MWEFRDPRLPDRFWNKVVMRGTGCWDWVGAVANGGYGSFRHRYSSLPHRLAYRYLVGEIPEGYEVDHLCKVRTCVFPGHLEAVTPRVNALRSNNVAAHYAQRDACKWGHPFSPENTVKIDGCRNCLTCRQNRAMEATIRRRARNFAKECPDMVCPNCERATPFSVAMFDWLDYAFCGFCGEQMKGEGSSKRPLFDTNDGQVAS